MIKERYTITEEIPIIFTDGLIKSIHDKHSVQHTRFVCKSCNDTECYFTVNANLKKYQSNKMSIKYAYQTRMGEI